MGVASGRSIVMSSRKNRVVQTGKFMWYEGTVSLLRHCKIRIIIHVHGKRCAQSKLCQLCKRLTATSGFNLDMCP